MKVICAGLCKTGKTSLAKALRILGFTVFDSAEHRKFHLDQWFDVYVKGKSPDFAAMYKDIDAVADLPPAFWFQEIYEAFPDAKVILTLRDDEEIWVESFSKQNEFDQTHGGFLNRLIIKWPYVTMHWIRRKPPVLQLLDTAMLTAAFGSLNSKSTVLFKKKYREHNERVQAVIPKDKLLIYNVNQGWKPLCTFLGCNVPALKFPRENVALSDSKHRLTARLQQRKRDAFVILAICALLVSVCYSACWLCLISQ